MSATAPPLPSRRERARAATVEEIKAAAVALMRESGTVEVRFADIARTMGMTAPALYRYFAGRDDLLTALVTDGFESFGSALRDALASTRGDLEARVLAAAAAYRRWATADPQRFALIFGLPAPGFAPSEGPVMRAFRAAMGNFQEIVLGTSGACTPGPPLVADVGDALATQIRRMAEAHRHAAPPDAAQEPPLDVATYQALLQAWAAIHGFASLEAFGHLGWLSDEARDDLFMSQVAVLARAMGGPAPPP